MELCRRFQIKRNNWLSALNQQKRLDFNSNNKCVIALAHAHTPTELCLIFEQNL